MKKSILLIGAVAVGGYIGLTAFGGQTKAQQEAEIASAIQTKLDNYRTELQAACDEKVAAEAKSQYETWAAAEAAKPVPPTPDKKGAAKKNSKKTTPKKVDPLPNPTPPKKDETNRGRGDATNTTTPGENKKRGDAVPTTPGNNRQRGDAVKKEKEGGN